MSNRSSRTRVGRGVRLAVAALLSVLILGWMYSPVRGIVITAGLLTADRLLLHLESKGWLNYRRVGLSRGAATYHTLTLSSAFDPGFQEVIDVKYADEKQEDDSGGPPTPDDEVGS